MTYEMGITIIWAILVYVFYKIGKQEGSESERKMAVEVVVDQLVKEKVIHIAEDGQIRPGEAEET
mgnify:FL=1|tara:strand:- start:2560 stop:2754 length:195 start_codon:yes stop_codon:yes gene_type:complete